MLLDRLHAAAQIGWSRASLYSASVPARKEPTTGPNPTDWGKPGTKRHLVTDARGTPLCFCLSGAIQHDTPMLATTLDVIQPLRNGRRGRPRQRPDKLRADKAYDAERRRQEWRARGIVPRIARKGVESSERLGCHRWVVDRTHAWFNHFRSTPIRYDRLADIYEALPSWPRAC